jgi:hypothetical protein
LLQYGAEQKKKEVPTLKEFAPKFLENYAKADRHKPSGIASKESIVRIHLVPILKRAAEDRSGMRADRTVAMCDPLTVC